MLVRTIKVSMSMASSFVVFSVFHLLIILKLCSCCCLSDCQDSFQCGNLGVMKYPLSNYSQPECGLLWVDCTNPMPKLYLPNEKPSLSYEIRSVYSSNVFMVHNPSLLSHLKNIICDLPYINFALPNSPSISFTISPNTTLFTCSKSKGNNTLRSDFWGFNNYSGCAAFDVYYTTTGRNILPTAPEGCSAVTVPMSLRFDPNSMDFFDLFEDDYQIEWHVSDICEECHAEGGKCVNDSRNEFHCQKEQKKGKPKLILIAGVPAATSLVVLFLVILLALNRRYYIFDLKGKMEHNKDIELFLKSYGDRAPRRYKYSYLKKITNSFHDELGEGGFATVYRGKLHDGHPVAVKILKESKGNGQEFINEVASISKTSHVNIVTLLGFCIEGSKRALLYEFMPNGSLDKFISNNVSLQEARELGWAKLLKIAIGIARGIEYLHQGCNTRILHFDIKPHNILLDEDFNPKISDFGLAILCPNRSSEVSTLGARGTIGYIAPEFVLRSLGQVSYKSDVYSYGMMVLEMVGETKNIDVQVDNSSIYFPQWIYKHLEQNAQVMIDPNHIVDEDEHMLRRKMTMVGLWCIQTDPTIRPSMTRVVEMLEGSGESLQIPPQPYISSHQIVEANSSVSMLAS